MMELRPTGIGVVSDMPWGKHFCHFYETKEDLLDTLVPYFKAGLDNNECCLWVICEPLSEADATNALRTAVPGIDKHLSAGDIEIVSHRNWYLKNGGFGLQQARDDWKDKVDEALAKGYAGVRVTGHTVWVEENGWADFAAYEKSVDDLIGDLRMTALCTYSLNTCAAAQVLDVVSSHQFALAKRNGHLQVVEASEANKAKAEIERLNQELEDRVLQRTRELATANEELKRESIERRRAEAKLRQDIRERKLAAQALRNAEQKYRDIFENAGEGIFQTTAEGQYMAANPALARIHGFDSPEELIRSRNDISRQTYVDSARREEFKSLLEQCGVVRGFEHEIFRKDGSKIWISVNARVVRDELGRIRYYEGTVNDITDRKHAEGDLIKQKEILEKIVDHIPVMINFTDKDGRIKLVNREWQRTLGWSLEEALRKDLDLFVECYPDSEYRQWVLDFIEAANGDWADFKTRVKDGAVIDTSWARVKLSDGTTLGIGQDITERKRAEAALRESEERYRDLVENSEELMCTHDLEGRILSANRAAATALGYQSQDYNGKKNLRDILAPEVWDQFADYRARLQKEGFAKGLMLIQTSTGERRIWEYYNTLRTEGVATPIVRGMAHDITERMRAEKEREVISEVIESVSVTTNLNELLKLVHQSLKKVVYAENCLVALYDKETELFSQPFFVDERFECPPPQAFKNGLTAYVFRTGLPFFSTEEKFRSLREQGEVELIGAEAKAWLGVPLKTPAETIGVLVVQHYERADAYKQRDLEFLCSVGSELALAIERKRTETALRESEERYRELFENARDAIYVHDLSGKYTSVNRAAEKLSGYPREEIIGKHFAGFVAPEHVKQVREKMWEKLRDEGETSYEMDIVASDGQHVPVEVSSRLIYEKGAAVGVQGMARDITERQRAREALRVYSRRLIEAQEEERQRIARELHDQIGQVLTAVQFNLHTIQHMCNCPAVSPHVEDGIKVLEEALAQVRDLSFDLRPSMLDDLGLVPALRWYVARQVQRTGIPIEVRTDLPDHNMRFGRELETACFRIAQEALTNVGRHSHARRASIRLQIYEADLLVIIKDDGVGLDVNALARRAPRAATLGLQGMQERAQAVGGTIEIGSTPSQGTEIRCSFPIEGQH